MTAEDLPSADAVDWRWIAEARLAAMQMQALSEVRRKEAVTIARTVMLALTAYSTPIGRSPLMPARDLARDLAKPYSVLEATALHCAALLFFFDLIEAKEYHDIGLPQEFWHFGGIVLNGIGLDHRPMFGTDWSSNHVKEGDAWVVARADRVRRALAAIAGSGLPR